MSFWQRTKDLVGWETQQDNSKVGAILNRKVLKKSVVAVGTMQAGKTTYFAALGATGQYKASDSVNSDRRFRFIIKEAQSNVLDDIAELRAGHFPEATTARASTTIRPAYTLEYEDPTFLSGRFNTIRQLNMDVIDYAGEQLVGLMTKVKEAKTLEQMSAIGSTDQLTTTVNQASALLLIVNATRAEGLPIFKPEPYEKIKGMSKHPDVNMQRIIGPILEYKHENRQYCPPLERIGVVFTACDTLFPISEAITARTGRPFKPLDPDLSNDSLNSFLKAFFPGTHSLIASLGVNMQYFPSYFELEKDVRGKIQYWDTAETQPKIKRGNIFDSPDWEHNVNRPVYTEYWYNRQIEWLKEIATRA